MLHTVYIYNDDKEIIQTGQIYCDRYYIMVVNNHMVLLIVSGSMHYHINGSYIIVI